MKQTRLLTLPLAHTNLPIFRGATPTNQPTFDPPECGRTRTNQPTSGALEIRRNDRKFPKNSLIYLSEKNYDLTLSGSKILTIFRGSHRRLVQVGELLLADAIAL